MCSGGSWWRFKVLGSCVFVIKSLRMLWVFSVVVRLDSGNGCSAENRMLQLNI